MILNFENFENGLLRNWKRGTKVSWQVEELMLKRVQMVWTGRYLKIMVVLDDNWAIVNYNENECEEGVVGETGYLFQCCQSHDLGTQMGCFW